MKQSITLIVLTAWLGGGIAEAQYRQASADGPTAQCLSNEIKQRIEKNKEAHRSKDGEVEEPFDPDYLVGDWGLEWVTPDSPMSSAGDVTGMLALHYVEACLYEGAFTGKTPDGAFTSTVRIMFDPAARYMVWEEKDSRGIDVLRVGRVGGDLGGYYTHFWDQPVFGINGHKVRLRGTTFFQSPVLFVVRAQISVDDEPYVNFGTANFRKTSATPIGGK
jgi:hypothetical protein